MYRHQKHVQYELTQESLETKRESLEQLEKSEREARRLEEALGRGRVDPMSASQSISASVSGSPEQQRRSQSFEGQTSPPEEEEVTTPTTPPEPERLAEEQSAYLPPHPGPNPVRRRAPGMGFLNALTYTLHGMMDVDPETARRNSISKTRETIAHVRT